MFVSGQALVTLRLAFDSRGRMFVCCRALPDTGRRLPVGRGRPCPGRGAPGSPAPDTSLREPFGVSYDGTVVPTPDISIIEHRRRATGRRLLIGAKPGQVPLDVPSTAGGEPQAARNGFIQNAGVNPLGAFR
jgi:hypothetical protein